MPSSSATTTTLAAARQTLSLEAPAPHTQRSLGGNNMAPHAHAQSHQQRHHPYYNNSSSNQSHSHTHQNGGNVSSSNSSHSSQGNNGASPLEIAYSTISPKVDAQPPYPMHIKLSLIDQNAGSNGDSSSCESPFPMTPMTPGGSVDLSKKQRHNLREQRRILRISNQFDILRNKLEGAGYQSSKKDKFTVLQATLDYIAYLERNQQQALPTRGNTSSSNNSNSSHHHSHIPQPPPPAPIPQHRLPSPAGPSRLSITAPPPSQLDTKSGASFIIDSMPSPVPALSMPGGMQQFPIDLDSTIFGGAANPPASSFHVDSIEGSSATYKDVFSNSSMPSLLAKLDGTIVEANSLFLELCCKNIDELRLHSLYTMCTAMDAPKMYSLVNKILSCEMASAQSKMMWHFSSNTGDRKYGAYDYEPMSAGVCVGVDDPRQHASSGEPALQPAPSLLEPDCIKQVEDLRSRLGMMKGRQRQSREQQRESSVLYVNPAGGGDGRKEEVGKLSLLFSSLSHCHLWIRLVY